MIPLDNIKNISIADFDYPLPAERIPLHPLSRRDACRLLFLAEPSATPRDLHFSDLPALLPADSTLVWNNTRVINARIRFRKPTGAQIEIFLLEPLSPTDYALMFQTRAECEWNCLVGNLKRWKSGDLTRTLSSGDLSTTLTASLGETLPGNGRRITFRWDNPAFTFADIIDAAGFIPIPPYLNRESEESDADDYQTVYARHKGSVAAPTAGLHFTPELITRLDAAGIHRIPLTLHVGAGTFQPVKADRIGDHPMHTEVFTISQEALKGLIRSVAERHPVVAVGTTSVRTLESLPLLGAALAEGDRSLNVGQWTAYSRHESSREDTLRDLSTLLQYMQKEEAETLTASTSIMIAPGFRWRMTDAIITNFHQPESTLLLLVSSFLGENPDGTPRWRKIYGHALGNGYRFLSYGDACLFIR